MFPEDQTFIRAFREEVQHLISRDVETGLLRQHQLQHVERKFLLRLEDFLDAFFDLLVAVRRTSRLLALTECFRVLGEEGLPTRLVHIVSRQLATADIATDDFDVFPHAGDISCSAVLSEGGNLLQNDWIKLAHYQQQKFKRSELIKKMVEVELKRTDIEHHLHALLVLAILLVLNDREQIGDVGTRLHSQLLDIIYFGSCIHNKILDLVVVLRQRHLHEISAQLCKRVGEVGISLD